MRISHIVHPTLCTGSNNGQDSSDPVNESSGQQEKSQISVAGVRAFANGEVEGRWSDEQWGEGKQAKDFLILESLHWALATGMNHAVADDYCSASMLKLLGREKYY